MLVQLYHSPLLAETDDNGNIQVFMLSSPQFIAFSEIQVKFQSINRLMFIECMMTGCRLSLLGSRILVNDEFKILCCLPSLIGWSRDWGWEGRHIQNARAKREMCTGTLECKGLHVGSRRRLEGNTSICVSLILCWPCIIMYHNNITNLMHFHFHYHKHFIVS
jgi:hypothetical protein